MKTFVRILKFAKPYWPLVIGAFIASIFFSLFNAGSLWVDGTLIGTIMGSSKEAPIDYDNSLSFVKQADNLFNQYILGLDALSQLKIVCLCLLVTFFIVFDIFLNN